MDSPQSVVSPFKNLLVTSEPAKLSDFLSRNSGSVVTTKGTEVQRKESVEHNMDDGLIGVLEVFVHQARDIQNICIYHKQDVYSKICLTSDPEDAVSTKIINGGGKNPVFNDCLRLNVRTVESSLKCEVWMMSRVKNYLEDQLLGFALVPMSEILVTNGMLENEFTLSSTDLFHSPAGFVQLSISYNGASPDVVAIPGMPRALASNVSVGDSEVAELDNTDDFSKIEFPDPNVVNENRMMVSEYFGLQCSSLDSQSSESYVSSDNENQLSSETGVQVVESFSTGTVNSARLQKPDSPPSSVSTDGSSGAPHPVSSQASDNKPAAKSPSHEEQVSKLKEKASDDLPVSKFPSQEQVSELKEKAEDSAGDGETDSSCDAPRDAFVMNVKPVQKVVQQDIVDMYMKSMQQFTESLAKMKLPLDMESSSGQTNSANSSTDQKLQASKSNGGSRVFYGSRAFF